MLQYSATFWAHSRHEITGISYWSALALEQKKKGGNGKGYEKEESGKEEVKKIREKSVPLHTSPSRLLPNIERWAEPLW
jgi:hypothetical protein